MNPSHGTYKSNLTSLSFPNAREEFYQILRKVYSGEIGDLDLGIDARAQTFNANLTPQQVLSILARDDKFKDRLTQFRAGIALKTFDEFVSKWPDIIPDLINNLTEKYSFNMFVVKELSVSYAQGSGLVDWDNGDKKWKHDILLRQKAYSEFMQCVLPPFLLKWGIGSFEISIIEPTCLSNRPADPLNMLVSADLLVCVHSRKSTDLRPVAFEFINQASARCLCYQWINPKNPYLGLQDYDWQHSI